jgi:hypothetical protein
MKFMTTAFVAALAIAPLATGTAEAACHFNTDNAILCQSAQTAASAYQAFGTNRAKADIDYNRQILREAYCARPFGSRYASVRITQTRSGRVATPSGWVPVVDIVTEDHDMYTVAKAYLSGVCEVTQANWFRPNEQDERLPHSAPPVSMTPLP